MLDLSSLWAQIEAEYTWRVDEVRFFQNQLIHLSKEAEQDQFRRATVLLLYAHYEGFCKFAFSLYVTTVNGIGIKCSEANYAIAAAALEDLFGALRHPDSKCVEFKSSLPDDKKLHIFARDREFVQNSVKFGERIVNIPDSVVDTESNLKPVVLRKNLFRLGFPHDGLKDVEGDISMLLKARNEIAHGVTSHGVTHAEYERLRSAAFRVMKAVKSYVMHALAKKEYLKAS